jgi:RHS repeat-associated protein
MMFEITTGLQNNWHRWYDPFQGRWMSEDPIGFEGDFGNLSRYAQNSPSNAVDPLGFVQVQVNGKTGSVSSVLNIKEGQLFVNGDDIFDANYVSDTAILGGKFKPKDIFVKFGVGFEAHYSTKAKDACAYWVQFVKAEHTNDKGLLGGVNDNFDWRFDMEDGYGPLPGYPSSYHNQKITSESADMVDYPGLDSPAPAMTLKQVGVAKYQLKMPFNNYLVKDAIYSEKAKQHEEEHYHFETYLIDAKNLKPVGRYEWSFDLFYTRFEGIKVEKTDPVWKSGIHAGVYQNVT